MFSTQWFSLFSDRLFCGELGGNSFSISILYFLLTIQYTFMKLRPNQGLIHWLLFWAHNTAIWAVYTQNLFNLSLWILLRTISGPKLGSTKSLLNFKLPPGLSCGCVHPISICPMWPLSLSLDVSIHFWPVVRLGQRQRWESGVSACSRRRDRSYVSRLWHVRVLHEEHTTVHGFSPN